MLYAMYMHRLQNWSVAAGGIAHCTAVAHAYREPRLVCTGGRVSLGYCPAMPHCATEVGLSRVSLRFFFFLFHACTHAHAVTDCQCVDSHATAHRIATTKISKLSERVFDYFIAFSLGPTDKLYLLRLVDTRIASSPWTRCCSSVFHLSFYFLVSVVR